MDTMRPRYLARRLAPYLVIGVLLASIPRAASAATQAQITGGQLVIGETSAAANVLGVAETSPGQFVLVDWASVPIAPGAGCSSGGSPNLVFCSGTVTQVSIAVGAGDDVATFIGSTPAVIDGGDGDDTLTGGSGNDVLRGGLGADVMVGGAGTDTADYGNHPLQPVIATADAMPDDGGPREGDDVRPDVEVIDTDPAPTTAVVECGELRIATHDSAANILGVALSSGTFVLVDWSAHAIAPGPGCTQGTLPFLVNCPATGITRITVDVGDGNDTAVVSGAVPAVIRGGNGNDALTGGSGKDLLLGGPGNDTLAGGGADDVLVGGPGADVMAGGDGWDTVNYRGHAAQPVTVTFDGDAHDGGPGEGDNAMPDVETSASQASPVVWVFGDSNTHGYGPYLVTAHPEWDVRVRGVGGETSAGGLVRAANELAAAGPGDIPDVVVVAYSTNDMVQHVFLGNPAFAPPTVGQNVAAIAALFEEAGAEVIVGLPLDAPIQHPGNTPENNAWIAAMQADYDAQRPGLERCALGRENVDFGLDSNSQFATGPLAAFHANAATYQNMFVPRAAAAIERALGEHEIAFGDNNGDGLLTLGCVGDSNTFFQWIYPASWCQVVDDAIYDERFVTTLHAGLGATAQDKPTSTNDAYFLLQQAIDAGDDAAILAFGTNDVAFFDPSNVWAGAWNVLLAYLDLDQIAQSAGVTLYIGLTPPRLHPSTPPGSVEAVNALVQAAFPPERVIDFYGGFGAGDLESDQIHLTLQGKIKRGRRAAEFLTVD